MLLTRALVLSAAFALVYASDAWLVVPATADAPTGRPSDAGGYATHAADVCPFGASGENATTFCSAGVAVVSAPAPVVVAPPVVAAAAATLPDTRTMVGGDGRLYKCCDSLDCSPSSPAYAGNCDILRPDCAHVSCPAEDVAFPPGVPTDPSCKTWKLMEEQCKCGCYCVCIYTSSVYGRRVKWLP